MCIGFLPGSSNPTIQQNNDILTYTNNFQETYFYGTTATEFLKKKKQKNKKPLQRQTQLKTLV